MKGLKDDLIKRLDEALRNERATTEEIGDDSIPSDPETEVEHADAGNVPVVTANTMGISETKDIGMEQTGNNVHLETKDISVEQEIVIERKGISGENESIAEIKINNVEWASISETKDNIMEQPSTGINAEANDKSVDQSCFDINVQTKDNSVEQASGNANIDALTDRKAQVLESTDRPDSVKAVEEAVVHETLLETSSVVCADVETTDKSMEQSSIDTNVQTKDSSAEQTTDDPDPVKIVEEVVHETLLETSTVVPERFVSEVGLCVNQTEGIEIKKENEYSLAQLENEEPKAPLENDDMKQHIKPEDAKPQHEDAVLESSVSNNQVSVVSPTLGIQVKSDSISTDSLSINEKNELKDNINADNVMLELDNVKLERVQPSSSDVVQDDGESHPMDVNYPHDNKVPIEEIDDTDAGVNKKNYSAEMVYSEKLNLDRSSGDDSMEEDVLDGKQIDSKDKPDRRHKNEQPSINVVKEDAFVDVVGDDSSAGEKDVHAERKLSPAAVPSLKRNPCEHETGGNNEPHKRQRRWNPESLQATEVKAPFQTTPSTPKETVQPALLRRNLSRSNSSVNQESPKERVVPPSQKTPTNSLRIDQFLRPFTLKAVQELLGKTGTVGNFWMDHIKTHCYVTYSSVEEAIKTRNAVYNLQWPPNGGRLLVADFVDPQEVQMLVKPPPPTPATPVNLTPPVAAVMPPPQPQPSPRNHVPRQPSPRNHVSRQLPPPPPPPFLPPPMLARELPLPPPPPLPQKQDPPIVTLDDLFKKTKAAPRIYYLPLSEEQVAAKRAALDQSKKQ